MSQKSLIYAFVDRGIVILAEYSVFSGNFRSIAFQFLDGHKFSYLVENGYKYCVVADGSAGILVLVAFVERIKDEIIARYGGAKAATTTANSLNKGFGSKLKDHVQCCVDHPEGISKLSKMKAQGLEVKGVMAENIGKVLVRGERIEFLVEKTATLNDQAQDTRSKGTQLPSF